jgi:putative ATPase
VVLTPAKGRRREREVPTETVLDDEDESVAVVVREDESTQSKSSGQKRRKEAVEVAVEADEEEVEKDNDEDDDDDDDDEGIVVVAAAKRPRTAAPTPTTPSSLSSSKASSGSGSGQQEWKKILSGRPKAAPSAASTSGASSSSSPASATLSPAQTASLLPPSHVPLAERLRPQTLAELHLSPDTSLPPSLVGRPTAPRPTNKPLSLPTSPTSLLFWGPPGCGKTSAMTVLSSMWSIKATWLHGSSLNVTSLRKVLPAPTSGGGRSSVSRTLLCIDEIHRCPRPVQDALLPALEQGTVKLLAATTENPSFALSPPLLSRLSLVRLAAHSPDTLGAILDRAAAALSLSLEADAVELLLSVAGGDARRALNLLEAAAAALPAAEHGAPNVRPISGTLLRDVLQSEPTLSHSLTATLSPFYTDDAKSRRYSLLSALHKTIRASDEHAALLYLTMCLNSGVDPLIVARRLIRAASEDIGIADSSCLSLAIDVHRGIRILGMPEADALLAHLTLRLARADKSIAAYRALKVARSIVDGSHERWRSLATRQPGGAGGSSLHLAPPPHILNAPTKFMEKEGFGLGYRYPPEEGGWVGGRGRETVEAAAAAERAAGSTAPLQSNMPRGWEGVPVVVEGSAIVAERARLAKEVAAAERDEQIVQLRAALQLLEAERDAS